MNFHEYWNKKIIDIIKLAFLPQASQQHDASSVIDSITKAFRSTQNMAVFSFCVDILPDALIDAAQIFPANPLKSEPSTHNLNTAKNIANSNVI